MEPPSAWEEKIRDMEMEARRHRDAGELLRVQKAYLELLLDSAPEAILLADNHHRITRVNPQFSKVFGFSLEEVLGRRADDLIVPVEKREEASALTERVGRGFQVRFESSRSRKDGTLVYVEGIASPVLAGDAQVGTFVSYRDVSERKKAEEEKRNLQAQLFHAQKMEAIGTLAGGIAHDFNNLLMGIQGRVSLMIVGCEPSHPFHDHLQGIQEYVQSAADLTKQLLGFARGGKYEVRPTDLNRVLKKSCEMFGRTKKEISIHIKYREPLWVVEVDRGQIEQVLINLFVNAWQSMPGGGDLFVETENAEVRGAASDPYGLREGRYVRVSITDTGTGMDARTRQRVFDPFFTTKEMGRGTGLGLASAYGIVKNHGGIIQVKSRVGEGSEFTIFLPVTEKEVVLQDGGSEQMMRGNETVLLVDDEEMILEVGLRMLIALGYDTITARTGKEALELYLEKRKAIHLIILDMIMPGMSGKEVFEELKKIDPEVRVLLSSGYSMDNRAKELMESGCKGFIQKPFTLATFSRKLREVLES